MINISDHSAVPLPPSDPILGNCRASVSRRLSRTSALPPLNIDPLSPLPLADAAKPTPAVRFVYFILASRPYAHETINRNIRTLQRPGALEAVGSNESNLFLLHSDAKMSDANTELLKSRVTKRPDMYWLRKNRFVMWSGFSMVAAQLDVMGSLVARRLGFDTLITLSDADLTLRVDGEIRAFFAKYPGRSIMSIVQRHRDTRRYKLHENFRRYCWFECDKGSAFLVASPNGEQLDGMKVRALRCMRAMRVACHPVSPLTTHLSRQHNRSSASESAAGRAPLPSYTRAQSCNAQTTSCPRSSTAHNGSHYTDRSSIISSTHHWASVSSARWSIRCCRTRLCCRRLRSTRRIGRA